MYSNPQETMQTRIACQVSDAPSGVLARALSNMAWLNNNANLAVFTMFNFTDVSGIDFIVNFCSYISTICCIYSERIL